LGSRRREEGSRKLYEADVVVYATAGSRSSQATLYVSARRSSFRSRLHHRENILRRRAWFAIARDL